MTGRFCPVNDVEKYRSNLRLPPNERVVLFVGRLTKMKGMEFARSVIQRTSSNSDITYVFVGEGPYKDKLRDEFDDNILRMPGHVSYSKIDKYYKSADIYMHPSPHEGIPLSILEALDCEVPVVAREAGDVRFVTSNTVTTPEQMAELILTDNLEPIWLNKDKFTEAYQREKLNEVTSSVIG